MSHAQAVAPGALARATPKKIYARPKSQKYPAGLIKVGAALYSVFAYTDDDGKTVTGYDEWIVRSIKARRGSKSRYGIPMLSHFDIKPLVNLTKKVELVTWVRRSGKAGWATSIPKDFKKQFRAGGDLPSGLYSTKRAALVYAIRSHQNMRPCYDQWIADEADPEALAELIEDKKAHDAELKALLIRFKKSQTTQKTNTLV